MIDEIQSLWNEAGIQLGLLVSGIFGGGLSLFYNPHLSPKKKFLLFSTGVITAVFIPPALADFFSIQSESMLSFMGFTCGLIGMHVVNAVNFIATNFSKDPIRTISKVLRVKDK